MDKLAVRLPDRAIRGKTFGVGGREEEVQQVETLLLTAANKFTSVYQRINASFDIGDFLWRKPLAKKVSINESARSERTPDAFCKRVDASRGKISRSTCLSRVIS